MNLPAYYVPKSRQRLLSTTVFNQQYPRNKVTLGNPKWSIGENPSDPSESAIDVYLNPQNNLPTSTCFRMNGVTSTAVSLAGDVNVLNDNNSNLSAPQKELLYWHTRLGHVSFRKVQHLMRMGVLATSEAPWLFLIGIKRSTA